MFSRGRDVRTNIFLLSPEDDNDVLFDDSISSLLHRRLW